MLKKKNFISKIKVNKYKGKKHYMSQKQLVQNNEHRYVTKYSIVTRKP